MATDTATPAGLRVNTIVLAFTLVSGVVVFLRMFTRLVMTKGAGFEDICIVMAMLLSIALAVLSSLQVMNGLGEHSSSLQDGELETLLKAHWVSVWFYNLALTITKVAILTQYLRIFPIRRFSQACYGVLGFVICYGIWAVFSSLLICAPIAFTWNKSVPGGHCMNELAVWVTNAGVNIAEDLVIFAMPLVVVRSLQIPKSQKKGLVFMFALGASVTLVSVVRLYSLDDIANSNDVSFDNIAHVTLSAVEVNVGIICACLPAMRPLLARSMPQYFSAAPEYENMPVRDIEQSQQEQKTPLSTSVRTTRTTTPRSETPRIAPLRMMAPSRTDSAYGDVRLQDLKPTLSRTPSGRFSVTNSRPPSLRLATSHVHSRSASNTSLNSQARAARFQGRLDPLRMSPVTPFSPPFLRRPASPLASGSHTRQTSGARSPSPPPTRASKTNKRLPVTPFPVGG